jgi:hypothetical protein
MIICIVKCLSAKPVSFFFVVFVFVFLLERGLKLGDNCIVFSALPISITGFTVTILIYLATQQSWVPLDMIICIVKCLSAQPVSFFFVVFVFVFLLEKEFDLYYVIYIQLSDFLGCDTISITGFTVTILIYLATQQSWVKPIFATVKA